jgi:ribosome biogenesis GTPase
MSLFQFPRLRPWGWDDFFESQFNDPTLIPARVIGEEKNAFRLQTESGTCWGKVSGHFHFTAGVRRDLPATGDWVACAPAAGTAWMVIHRRLERKSCLTRKMAGRESDDQILAANINTVFIVTSANGDLNPRRLERYLTLVWNSGAAPVILLTKVDLAPDVDEALAAIRETAIGVEVFAVSSLTGYGVEALTGYLGQGQTVVLIGSSGVGKSTLVNRLVGSSVVRTQEIREADDKGRHTTTSRYLFRLPSGGSLIDTPGMRELQLSDTHDEGLGQLFEDIEALAGVCRFSNCRHQTEPGCAIRSAIADGELDSGRWESYLKLQKEVRYHLQKHDKAAISESRQEWKKVNRALRAKKKSRG